MILLLYFKFACFFGKDDDLSIVPSLLSSQTYQENSTKTFTGEIEAYHLNEYQFNEQYNTFNTMGYSSSFDGSAVEGNIQKYIENSGETIQGKNSSRGRKEEGTGKGRMKRSRDPLKNSGPWTPFEGEDYSAAGLDVSLFTYLFIYLFICLFAGLFGEFIFFMFVFLILIICFALCK
jgi:hypothetical protein